MDKKVVVSSVWMMFGSAADRDPWIYLVVWISAEDLIGMVRLFPFAHDGRVSNWSIDTFSVKHLDEGPMFTRIS